MLKTTAVQRKPFFIGFLFKLAFSEPNLHNQAHGLRLIDGQYIKKPDVTSDHTNEGRIAKKVLEKKRIRVLL